MRIYAEYFSGLGGISFEAVKNLFHVCEGSIEVVGTLSIRRLNWANHFILAPAGVKLQA